MSTATLTPSALDRRARSRGSVVAQRPSLMRPSAPASETWGSVRLTRRGRIVLLLAAVAAVFGGFMFLGDPATSTGTEHHAPSRQVVVEPGQSLWEIAQQVAPGENTRVVVDEIVELNALQSAGEIRAGETLYVPVS